MKYTKEQRLEIGKKIYEGKLTRYQAAEKYGISDQTARDYMRLYRDVNSLPPKNAVTKNSRCTNDTEDMTKEELIREIVKARIAEARLKKGYEVKGDSSVILYDRKSIK